MIRDRRFSITVTEDVLQKLDEMAEEEGEKRATLMAELAEKYVAIQDTYSKVIDKEMGIVDVHELFERYASEIELVIGDRLVIDLRYDKEAQCMRGDMEVTFTPHVPWYKRIFGIK